MRRNRSQKRARPGRQRQQWYADAYAIRLTPFAFARTAAFEREQLAIAVTRITAARKVTIGGSAPTSWPRRRAGISPRASRPRSAGAAIRKRAPRGGAAGGAAAAGADVAARRPVAVRASRSTAEQRGGDGRRRRRPGAGDGGGGGEGTCAPRLAGQPAPAACKTRPAPTIAASSSASPSLGRQRRAAGRGGSAPRGRRMSSSKTPLSHPRGRSTPSASAPAAGAPCDGVERRERRGGPTPSTTAR